MPRRRSKKMFQVVVLGGVSLAACGGESSTGSSDAGPDGQGYVTTNPPAPPRDGGVDAPADAPTDALGDEMPIIK